MQRRYFYQQFRSSWVLFLLVVCWLVVLILSFDGFFFYDDIYYARKAAELSQGIWQFDYVLSHRIGLYAPVAGLYYVFGISEWTSLLYPVMCSVGCLCIFGYALKSRRKAPHASLWAAMLLLTDYYVFFFAGKLYPDTVLMLWALLACLMLYHRHRGKYAAWGMAISLFAGLLTKETIVYLAPALLIVLVIDLYRRQHIAFWRHALLSGMLLLLAYMLFYSWHYGHPLYRFVRIQEEHCSQCGAFSYFDKPFIYTLRRITYQPLFMFISADMWMAFATAWVALLYEWRRYGRLSVWGIAFCSVVAMFWWFTTSFRYYNPITLHARMILLMVPIAAMLAARHIHQWQTKEWRWLSILLAAAGISHAIMAKHPIAVLYLLKASLCLLMAYKPQKPALMAMCFFAAGMIHPMHTAYKAQKNGTYYSEKRILHKYFSAYDSTTYIWTDNRLANGGDFFFAFRKQAPHFIELSQSAIDSLLLRPQGPDSRAQHYLLRNDVIWQYFRQLSGITYKNIAGQLPLQIVEQDGSVYLYKIGIHKQD